jgi:putative membrane protein
MSDDFTPSGDRILKRAAFDARLPTYYLFVSCFTLLVSFIGIPLLPFWVLGLGQYVHRRQYESLESELTARTLNLRSGFLFRTQKNIPLDKITDLTVNEGPVLRRLGLCALRVETAGNAMGQAHLPGVIDAVAFRDAVLRQRDLVTAAQASAPAQTPTEGATLTEIRDALVRIERLLAERLEQRG